MNEKTLQLLAKALEADPRDLETRCHLAELYVESDRHDDARKLIEVAELTPDDEERALTAAEGLSNTSDEIALLLLDGILSLNKACAGAHMAKAGIYRNRDDRENARKHYNVAVVILESLEDPAFEAWLDGDGPPEPVRVPANGPGEREEPSPDAEEEIDEDFIDTEGALDELFAGRPRIRFEDVGGMDDLKERIRMKIVYPFMNEGVFAKFRKKAGGGLLLYGPPGCGKTLMARATAGECDAFFMSVSISEMLSSWRGETEARLHEVFESARRRKPSVIFIDEIDALGIKRSDAGSGMGSVVNVLLTEIDGASSENDDILVIGATNTPWRVDNAFRRPGRFDKTIFVPPPDSAARRVIFDLLLKDLPADQVDLEKLVRATERFSGADLRLIVDTAVEAAIAEEMKTGKNVVLTQKMMTTALKGTKCTTLEWLEQASNYASYANQSGLYDELSEFLGGKK